MTSPDESGRGSAEAGDESTSARVLDRALRERGKELARERRERRKYAKRKCILCGATEDEKSPFVPHDDGTGPVCSNRATCEANRLRAARSR
jgi:hypothetical protein